MLPLPTLPHLVDQDGLGAELVAAVDQVTVRQMAGQVQGLSTAVVAAADHDHVLVAVEETVGRWRSADTPRPMKDWFGRQAQVLRPRRAVAMIRRRRRILPVSPVKVKGAWTDRPWRCGRTASSVSKRSACFEALHQVGTLHAIRRRPANCRHPVVVMSWPPFG